MAPSAITALVGRTILFEGYRYAIVADDPRDPAPQGAFRFVRAPETPKKNGTYRRVTASLADLRPASDDDPFDYYLPGRCAPLLAPRLQDALRAGALSPAVATQIGNAIVERTASLGGRDDLAEAKVCAAFGVELQADLPADVVPPSVLPAQPLDAPLADGES